MNKKNLIKKFIIEITNKIIITNNHDFKLIMISNTIKWLNKMI